MSFPNCPIQWARTDVQSYTSWWNYRKLGPEKKIILQFSREEKNRLHIKDQRWNGTILSSKNIGESNKAVYSKWWRQKNDSQCGTPFIRKSLTILGVRRKVYSDIQKVRLFACLASIYRKQGEEMLCQNEETSNNNKNYCLQKKKRQKNPQRMTRENKTYMVKELY